MSAPTMEAKEKRELVEIVRATREGGREERRLRFAAEEVTELKKAVRVFDDDDNDDEVGGDGEDNAAEDGSSSYRGLLSPQVAKYHSQILGGRRDSRVVRHALIGGMDYAYAKRKNNVAGKFMLVVGLTVLCIIMLKRSSSFNTSTKFAVRDSGGHRVTSI